MYLNLFERYWAWVRKYHDKIELKRAEKENVRLEKERKLEKQRIIKEKYPEAYQQYLNMKRKDNESVSSYPISAHLDELVLECLDSGVVSFSDKSYLSTAKFKNGSKIEYWSRNKMYAYASKTEVTIDGRKIDFSGQIPTLLVRYVMKVYIEERGNSDNE